MFHVAYVSSAVREFTKPQLRGLLKRSRARNQRLQITGLLLYQGGNFLQVLEGDESDVRKLFRRICEDPRHKDIYTLFEEAIPEREFPDWSMAFRDLDVEDCSGIPGYSDFLLSSWSSRDRSDHGSKARKLLAGFKENMR